MIASQAIKIRRTKASTAEWDAFALRCGASYRGLSGWIKIWQIRHHMPFRILRYDIFQQRAGVRTKIGQCAIGIGLHSRVFADGLQLLPDCQDAWASCLQAIVTRLGPGRYMYGSDWSLEPPRENQICAIPGAVITNVDRHVVEGVDFAQWGSWEDYERNVSSNIRRNIKKAQKKHPVLRLHIKRGAEALAFTHHLLHCKTEMYRRKSVPIDTPRMIASHILRSLFMPDHNLCAIIRTHERTLAAFGGAEVGHHLYYFDGGSVEPDGTGWLLKMTLMRDFYRRNPTGRFLMGTSSQSSHDLISEWESSSRYRRDARVSGFPTSMVTFTVS